MSLFNIPAILGWARQYGNVACSPADLVIPLTVKRKLLNASESNRYKRSLADKGIELHSKKAMFCFIGSLSPSFDFKPIIQVAKRFQNEAIECVFVICGNGDRALSIQGMAKHCDNIIFPGWVNENEISIIYSNSLASLAPYKNSNDFKDSIPNKILDSLANRTPILTSLQGEVQSIIEETQAGLCYDDAETLYKHCLLLMQDEVVLQKMRRQADRCYIEQFDHEQMYGKLAQKLEDLGGHNE